MDPNSALNASSSLCLTAAFLADSMWIKSMYTFRCIFALLGLTLLYFLCRVQGTQLAFHENARILWTCHHTWAILECVANFVAYFFFLIRSWPVYANPCQYLNTTTMVIIIRGPAIFTQFGQIWGLASMSVERTVATMKYRTYESSGGRLGKFLALNQWLLSILWFYLAINNSDWTEMKANNSLSSSKTSARMSNLLISLACIEAVTLATFCGLLLFNKHRKQLLINESLTVKYQVDENLRAIYLMIPMVVTHFVCFIPTLTFFPIFLKLEPNAPPLEQGIYSQAFFTSPYYATIVPIILFWRNTALRANLKKSMGMNQVMPHVILENGRTLEQVHHFNTLKMVWDEKKH